MSPRSSLLFLICKSDLPPLQPNTGRSLFADDLMFYTEDTINTSAYIRSNLQSCLNNFVDFSVDHRLILSCSKSVSTLFEKKRSGALASKDHRLFPPFLPPSLQASHFDFILTSLDTTVTLLYCPLSFSFSFSFSQTQLFLLLYFGLSPSTPEPAIPGGQGPCPPPPTHTHTFSLIVFLF